MNIHEVTNQILTKIYGDSELSADTTRQSVESILTQWVEELIGEDEPETAYNGPDSGSIIFEEEIQRNKLRAELRNKAGLTPPQEGE